MSEGQYILVVDDDEDLRSNLLDLLRNHNYTAVGAGTAGEALQEIHNKAPAVALIDIKLFDKSGTDLFREIKELSPRTECIVLTGHSSQDVAIEAANAGVISFLRKPYSMNQLLDVLSDAFNRRVSKEVLRESEMRFREIFDHIPDGVVLADMTTKKFDMCNKAFAEMLGRSTDEVTALTVADIHRKEDLPGIIKLFEKMAGGEITFHKEVPFLRKGGSLVHADVHSSTIELFGKKYLMGIMRDVTEQMKSEEKIETLARFPDENPGPVIRIDADGIPQFSNAASQPFMKNWECDIGRAVPSYLKYMIKDVLDSNQAKKIEIENDNRVYLFAVVPILEGGYVNMYGLDITERKRIENELERHRENLQKMVEERTAKLTTAINSLQQEVRERKRAEDDLKETLRFKSDFLASMSHELRAPLNSIIGYTDLVIKDQSLHLSEKRKKNLESVLVSADMLLGLIETILDMARMESGRIDVKLETFNLVDLLEASIMSSEILVGEKQLKIVTNIAEDFPNIHADKAKLGQILTNLLSNAIKFTESGEVRVSIERAPSKDDFFTIVVEDTGIGMNEDQCKRIFEQFHKIDASATKKYVGVGLGLSIVKGYVSLLGGDVEVESKLGKGAKFTVTLPVVVIE